jgi:hypothetical protein
MEVDILVDAFYIWLIILALGFLAGEIVLCKLWCKCKKIISFGVPGTGVLIRCKRDFDLRHGWLYPSYTPVISFYLGERLYEVIAIGIFHQSLKPIGQQVDIIYFEEYPEHVVIKGCNFRKMYLLSMLYYSAVHICGIICS